MRPLNDSKHVHSHKTSHNKVTESSVDTTEKDERMIPFLELTVPSFSASSRGNALFDFLSIVFIVNHEFRRLLGIGFCLSWKCIQ